MHKAKPWAIWSRDSAPTILVVPEGDGASTHEVSSYCAVRGRRTGAQVSHFAGPERTLRHIGGRPSKWSDVRDSVLPDGNCSSAGAILV